MNKPFVSILIPCYNAEQWVKQAVESALAQTWPEKEVIVVDDGSTDKSLNVIKSFGDKIRWETGLNRGGNAARNRLLELAHGEWLQYLDADDYLLPDKLAKQIEYLETNPTADVIFSPVTKVYCEAKEKRYELQPIPENCDSWILLARWYLPQTGAPLWRKQAIETIEGWNLNQPCCQEHELYLRLLMAGKHFAYCAYSGAMYRQWGEHTVCKRDKLEVLRRRLEIERRAEEFLRAHGELTPARHRAINQARFEMARLAWENHSQYAMEIIQAIKNSQPGFTPEGNSVPRQYQLLYRTLGFRFAESVAAIKRKYFGARHALQRD